MDVDAYAQQLRQLFPPGLLWLFETGSRLWQTTRALAGEFARVDARAVDVQNEWDPRTATETLPDWERVLGLPDDCATVIPTDVEERRQAIVQKLTLRRGQRPEDFLELCEALGATVTLTEFRPARCGTARCGDRMYGVPWAYAFRVTLSGPANPVLECTVRRAAPAHLVVQFVYV